MAEKPTTRRGRSLAGPVRRRALAIETLEARSLLDATGLGGTGLEGGIAGGAWNTIGAASDASGQIAATSRMNDYSAALAALAPVARGFAWRFGDGGYAEGSHVASSVSPFSPRFSAVIVSRSPLGGDAGFTKAYVIPDPDSGPFGCRVIVCSTSPGDAASPLDGGKLTLAGITSQRGTYLSSIDRVFDINYDATIQVWRLSPSATLERLLHDAGNGEHRGDGGMRLPAKDLVGIGGRGDDGMGSDYDNAQGGRSDDGDLSRGGLGGETGGFLALSTANDFRASSAVANVFADAAQRVAPSVVLGGESAIKGQFSGDADASANAAAPDVLPRTIVRSDDVRSQGDSNRVANPSTLDAAPRDDATNAGLPSRQATVDAGDEIPSATSGRAVHRALDSAGIDAAATAIAEGSSARQRNDDSARPDDDEQNAEVRRDSTVDGDPAAVANEHVWAYDEPHGGMIALAVSYLPVDVEPSHPAADAWVVEDARPRGEGGYDEPRFESSVGLYQVLEVATATPPVRSVIAPQTGAAALMASPLSNADEEANELATPVHEQAEASVGVAGWINPNYAAATVSVLVLAAGVTLHSKRPHSVARRLVDRLRNRAESGK